MVPSRLTSIASNQLFISASLTSSTRLERASLVCNTINIESFFITLQSSPRSVGYFLPPIACIHRRLPDDFLHTTVLVVYCNEAHRASSARCVRELQSMYTVIMLCSHLQQHTVQRNAMCTPAAAHSTHQSLVARPHLYPPRRSRWPPTIRWWMCITG